MAILPDADVPLGRATQTLYRSPPGQALLRAVWNLSGCKRWLRDPILVLSAMAQMRQPLEAIEARALVLADDPSTASLVDGLKHHHSVTGLARLALLVSEEALSGLQAFVAKPGGEECWKSKRVGQAFGTLLASPRARKATLAFLSQVEPSDFADTALIREGDHRITTFWYYLPVVYQDLMRTGIPSDEAGRRLVRLARRFDALDAKWVVPPSGMLWQDWLDQSDQVIAEKIDPVVRRMLADEVAFP